MSPAGRRVGQAGQWCRRALLSAGSERDALLLIGKSTLAATLAWMVSFYALDARSPAFAPFSAVLIMYVTVYQSVTQSLRYVGAVALGVTVQAALGFLAGPDLLTFVLVAAIALSIGRSRVLGVQGPQVATAAFFAFSTYSSATDDTTRITQLGQIVLLVLIGCAIGTAVNVTIAPPMRYRSAEYSVRTLARALHDLTADMHPALREGAPDADTTARWRERAALTGSLIDQARAGLNTAEESVHYNPRRLLRRHRNHLTFQGFETVLNALERTLYQLASLTRSLDQWQEEENDYHYRDFLDCYAAFLEAICGFARTLSTLDEAALPEQAERLAGLADDARARRREVAAEAEAQSLPLADSARPYGVLVVEATRLMEEVQHTSDTLHTWIEA
ncbi:aromatic acid exporter family protein [Streptomyces aurantiacus]|uniref:FUSC family protein n=1 Tax=Streptomyces aurantiacus TaxID=47760 RepID=UPI0016829A64|nr:aromatic acid exporter family protein [Streptomyces aurantiacus]